MTRYELMKSAIAHKPCRYTPYSIPLTVEAYDLYGDQLLKDYANEQVNEDLAKGILSKHQAVSLAIGNHLLYLYAPWWKWHNLSDAYLNDIDIPDQLPDTCGYGSYEEFFSLCDHVRKTYDVYPLLTIWGSHWEKANFARGIENFLYDMAGNPEQAQALLDMIIRKNICCLENLLSAGDFDGVLLGSDWGTQRSLIMSPKMWREMIRPGEEREYELVRRYGKDIWIHSCGCILDIMPDLCEMGVDVLNPVQPECMNLKFLKEQYGDRICYFGGISTQRVLPNGTVKDVIRVTEETIELMSRCGGYITAPSQEIQTDVPYENLRALIDTARAHSIG